MQCLRCRQLFSQPDKHRPVEMQGICLPCSLSAVTGQHQPPLFQNLEQPHAVMAQHAILQPRRTG